jgi:hypothetical protein
MRGNSRAIAALSALVIFALMTAVSDAGVVNLGSGWQASWDASLDGLVNVETVSAGSDALVIRKSAEFTQAPVNGIFPTIPIVFQQVAWPAAAHIVIDSETVKNSTGVVWTDFHLDLLDHGDAVFDPALTAASAGPLPIGWNIAPFTQAAFNATRTRLDLSGGVVANGQFWLPGGAPNGGQLWTDVVPSQTNFTLFTLKETPTPEPAAMSLLLLGGVCLLARKVRQRG